MRGRGEGLVGTGALGRCPTDRGAGPLPARSASTPETWAKFTQENLCRAERERLASVNLRGLIDCILRDVAEDLRLQCDAVNLAYGRRCEELEDARLKLEQHLRKVGPARPSHAQDAHRPRPGQPWGGAPVTRMRPGSFRRPPPSPSPTSVAPISWSLPSLAPTPSIQRQSSHSSLDLHLAD